MQKQDKLRAHLNKLQRSIEQEQNEFNKKWHSLGSQIKLGREGHAAKLKRDMETQGLYCLYISSHFTLKYLLLASCCTYADFY